MVLLRNDGLLPLDLSAYRRLAVIGPHATRPAVGGGGSAFVRSHPVVSPLDALREVAPHCEFLVEEGAAIYKLIPALGPAELGTDGAEIAFYADPDFSGAPVATSRVPTTDLIWLGEIAPGIDPTAFSARVRIVLRPPESGRYCFGAAAVGQVRLLLDGQLVLDNWTAPQPGRTYFGFGSAEVRAEVELEANRSYELVAEYRKMQPGMPLAGFRFGVVQVLSDEERIARAVRAAREADLALVFVGLSPEWESEGFDRESFDLPGAQNALVRAVAEVNPATVVVLTAGSPVALPWLEHVRALLLSWYAGEEVGHAVVDVLTGQREPSGHLPFTYPRRWEDTPAFTTYPGEFGRIRYCEGVFVGYRWYDARALEPLFPFGFGLGYTTFSYRDLRIDRPSIGAEESVQVACTVENVGAREGSDVVQLYVGFPPSAVRRPVKELRGFRRVHLQPGQAAEVRFVLEPRDLSFFDEAQQRWVTPAGTYTVMIGADARDVRLVGQFAVREDLEWTPSQRFRR